MIRPGYRSEELVNSWLCSEHHQELTSSPTVVTSDKRGVLLVFVCLSVCLSVSKIMPTQKRMRDDRCRDMDELIKF